ncbi:hypothetical protein GI374_11575 [Paracoccus sp. S-4012]|uniref:hypothetical protein n=1 Tax=Paracoccus sp. S-4012 TaxID=2665648 RepID=UPI0012AFB9DB|nr:hypothetical protein [Paracoccus sp. S-4012]MRX51076.1 hypothetical protein [Paracoccus sp. S-4012]
MTKSSVQQIIERWPSRRALAGDLGLEKVVIHRWHQRSSIPGEYFVPMLEVAAERGISLLRDELERKRQNGHIVASAQPACSGGQVNVKATLASGAETAGVGQQ